MATEQGWYYEWFANNWFPEVWFAPSDEEDVPLEERRPTGGGTDSHVLVNLHEAHKLTKERNEERFRLEAERIAEIEREASEVLARIARSNDPEPLEPVVIPIPESIEPEQVAQVEPLAPINDLVTTFAEPIATLDESVTTYADAPKPVQEMAKSIHDDNDTIALILILAEID
jgi:hypothetical protein